MATTKNTLMISILTIGFVYALGGHFVTFTKKQANIDYAFNNYCDGSNICK